MLSLMWSEHCAYKHSKKLLRRLPTEGPHVLLGPGENAGAVDVGDGLAIAFKVESHNHPSAVEPFQGAATGVGGILRDVFAVGARPIAVMNSWIDNCVGNACLVFETDKNKSFRRAGTLTANDVAGDLNRRTVSRLNEVDRTPNVWQVFPQEFHGMRSSGQIHGFVIRFHALG